MISKSANDKSFRLNIKQMLKQIAVELVHHAPFTALGAGSGIAIMALIILLNALPQLSAVSYNLFYVLHPLHVALSAIVITAMYKKHSKGKIWATILVGYIGSVGLATLSDSVFPYAGEVLLRLPHAEAHIGFIEEWLIVNPAAFLGIAIGYWKSITKLPHSGHVLVSTWASLFHIVMALGSTVDIPALFLIFLLLFISVWIPCCFSDIAFPVFLTGGSLPEHKR
jgi:hypothetical protein